MRHPVFYVPRLHSSFAPCDLPPGIAFFPCGLERARVDEALSSHTDAHALARTAEAAARERLPLDPAQAAALMSDLARMGEQYGPKGLLSLLVHEQSQQAHNDRRTAELQELTDLARFAQTGTWFDTPPDETRSVSSSAPEAAPDWAAHSQEAVDTAKAVYEAVVNCQKVLLLAYTLEEYALEADSLEQRYAQAEHAFLAALGDGDEDDAVALAAHGASFQTSSTEQKGGEPLFDWKAVVDAALPFFPENARLFTADPVMAADMWDAGLLQPLPKDCVVDCASWSPELLEGMMFASLPGWRLVGRKKPLPDRPWLDKNIEILVARPPGGWLLPE